ncbi:hypothetical protein JCM8097_007207 [Rhodosporidiobolus ruineniae]
MVSCQRCRQPLTPSSFPSAPPPPSSSSAHPTALDDSIALLSPSAYDFLTQSEHPHHPHARAQLAAVGRASELGGGGHHHRLTVPAPPQTAGHKVGGALEPPQGTAGQRPPSTLGPADSFVVLTQSVYSQPAPPASLPSSAPPSSAPTPSIDPSSDPSHPAALTPHLAHLSHLYSLLSSSSSVDHPLCTECAESLVALLGAELEQGKKERDRLVAFEKEVLRRRDEAKRQGQPVGVKAREALEKDIAKLKRAEQHDIAELKTVEARKQALEAEKRALDEEEAALAAEEAEFWTAHSHYLLRRDQLLDRQSALSQRLHTGQRELDKLQRTNVYNDAFCIGQEAGFGTINGLRLGRLPGVSVDWPEINAAWGQTLLLLHTVARKFGFPFSGYRLVPCGSFSRIERVGEGGEVTSLELYGSSDLSVTRLLQNRRFDQAMVAFLECLRQLSEWVVARDRSVRLPHAVVKDRIGDVSIKLTFGSDESWTRALRHVLLDLKILLGRASL